MKKRYIFLFPMLLCGIMVFTSACAVLPEDEETAQLTYEISYIENMEDLERGNCYVETENGYALPYWGDTTFDTTTDYTTASTSKVAWFDDENWEMIPTLYKGGHIVLRTDNEFKEEFYFERYIDAGYSVGLCNLSRTDTGRYKVSTSSGTQIDPNSDAEALTDLGDINITIDTIGGQPLRSSLVNECGMIEGLEKGQTYEADVYVGTEIHPYTFTADSRILYSAQVNTTTDYEFVQAEVIEIEIPEYFNSGYYSLNGSGIFRYVAGDSYDETTDFNELNYDDSIAAADAYSDSNWDKESVSDTLEIPETGSYTLRITYGDEVNETLLPDSITADDVPAPTVKLYLGDETITLEDVGNNIVYASFSAEAGTYSLDLEYIYGREYSIGLVSEDSETETQAETVADESMGTADNPIMPEETETVQEE